jgi:hypothetical protein
VSPTVELKGKALLLIREDLGLMGWKLSTSQRVNEDVRDPV